MVRLSANLSFMFREVPFLRRFRAAAACGFRAVEFMFPGDGGYEHAAGAVRSELGACGLQQVLINGPAGNWAAGERGLGGLPGREAEWQAAVRTALSYARELSCGHVHLMAGLQQHGAREATLVERLRWASGQAAEAGVCLCVEPLNARDFPGYLVPDTATALRVLEAVGRPECCRLQLDLYHLQVSEGDLSEAIRRLLPYAAHVQIANPPGRHEPGVGEVHFPPLLELLDSLGYEGHVGCEYRPSVGTEQSLAWAAPYGVAAPARA
mmetsp:Transcript_82428/g.267034  ORF Transcript_82428/g.267034 Transcript_82428/m.267034 type:complete len:267 (+) Transcript_82428:96-896(+)